MKANGILIEKLVFSGSRKNYIIPLKPGLNIIYGDSATGKSSILECINYLFGSSKFIFDEEIEAAVSFVMMQVTLGESTFVVKRDIFDAGAEVEVYAANLESYHQVFPKKLSANYGKNGTDGFLSDFYLSALGMPIVSMRQAPTKVDSEIVRLSFRDVFKFCYLKQDEVGTKFLLSQGSYAGVKNKETFKYIFNLLDTAISDLHASLSNAVQVKRNKEDAYKVVSEFLRTVQFKTEFDLDDAKVTAEDRRTLAKRELTRINDSITANNEGYLALKDILSTITIRTRESEESIHTSDRLIEQYVRLKNDYQADIQKLNAIKKSKQLIGTNAVVFSCPLCDSQVDLNYIKTSFDITEMDHVSQEINSITRRMRDADQLAQRERSKRAAIIDELKLLREEGARARNMLDEELSSSITPYLAERDGWSLEVARATEEIANIDRNLKIRNQQKSIFQELHAAEELIKSLQEQLSKLMNSAPSISDVLGEIGDALTNYLRDVQIADIRDVRISERTFLPVLRNRDYQDITSGGLRTILSIGHFISILSCALQRNCNHPGLLMIDTVGKYLGKTDSKYGETDAEADTREGTSDPKKYKNIYKALMKLCATIESKSGRVQIIAVDNDLPGGIESASPGAIAAYFRIDGRDGTHRGLIDDAHLH